MPLTEVDDLIARLERDPENDVLAAMLCDELMDARGMYRFEAMGYVRNLQTDARAALDIAFVAKVLRAAGPKYVYLIERIRRSLEQPEGTAFVLFLIGGEDAPRIGVTVDQLAEDDPGPGLYVALGCTWARKELERSALPLCWPKSPKRVVKLLRTVQQPYRIPGRRDRWASRS